MTLRSAVSLMRQASYRRGVVDVTLRNPLGPRRSNPLYIFGCSDGWDAAVDAGDRWDRSVAAQPSLHVSAISSRESRFGRLRPDGWDPRECDRVLDHSAPRPQPHLLADRGDED
jgi:hypothetical protein